MSALISESILRISGRPVDRADDLMCEPGWRSVSGALEEFAAAGRMPHDACGRRGRS